MQAPEKPFDPDALINLKTGVQQEALEAFFQSIAVNANEEETLEIARFATRAAWRVLPEILTAESLGFEPPIKRYVFAASCLSLFAATHPDAEADDAFAISVATRATTYAAEAAAYAAEAAVEDAYGTARAAAYAAEAAARNTSLSQPLLLALREDLFALHSRQALAGCELWPKESASLFNVDAWFSEFSKNVERYALGYEILRIYQTVLDGSIERALYEYPPDLFKPLLKSTQSDYEAWKQAQSTDAPKQSTGTMRAPAAATAETESGEAYLRPGREIRVARIGMHSESPSAVDHLDQERLAEVLASWLKNPENKSHAAIGLFGDWGVGKSTFVNLLRDHLRIPLGIKAPDAQKVSSDHYKTADYIGGEFNAWQYEHTENIQAGMAHELIAALKANLKWWEKMWLSLRYRSFDVMIAASLFIILAGIVKAFPQVNGLPAKAGSFKLVD